MSAGAVHFSKADGVASVVFDRPEAHNAMTMAMYDQLSMACAAIAADSNLRVATFRGTGEAFAAGTDIREFLTYDSAEDGIAYVVQVVQREGIEDAVNKMCRQLVSNAPITMQVAKESIRRLSTASPQGDDLIRVAYGSSDFRAGVRAFLAKQHPQWTGR